MGRKLDSKDGMTNDPILKATEDFVVIGYFDGAEAPPNAESRALYFLLETGGPRFAIWETGVLKKYASQMTEGTFYTVTCKGKTLETKKGKAWDFDVFELTDDQEIGSAIKAHGAKLAFHIDTAKKEYERSVKGESEIPF